MNKQYQILLLTPTLCHGASRDIAEVRIPSIRGHLRKWHTILWGEADTNYCWGSAGKPPVISKVVLRTDADLKTSPQNMLPHKKENVNSIGINANQCFTLQVSYRNLPGGNEDDKIKKRIEATIQIWLLLGTVGQRSTRAFGSVWSNDLAVSTLDDFCKKVSDLFPATCSYAIQVLEPLENKIELKYCTDTLDGYPDLFGAIKPSRQTSPLKMKYIKIGEKVFLLLHAKKHQIVNDAIKKLENKPLGQKFKVIKRIN